MLAAEGRVSIDDQVAAVGRASVSGRADAMAEALSTSSITRKSAPRAPTPGGRSTRRQTPPI